MGSLLKALARAYGGGSDTAVCRVKFEKDGEGWKADKSYEEVLAAYQAGAHVEAEVPNEEMPEEVLILPLRFNNTSKSLTALTFYWERTFVPPGGYGDVYVYSITAVLQPSDTAWVDISGNTFPACTCGREQPPV